MYHSQDDIACGCLTVSPKSWAQIDSFGRVSFTRFTIPAVLFEKFQPHKTRSKHHLAEVSVIISILHWEDWLLAPSRFCLEKFLKLSAPFVRHTVEVGNHVGSSTLHRSGITGQSNWWQRYWIGLRQWCNESRHRTTRISSWHRSVMATAIELSNVSTIDPAVWKMRCPLSAFSSQRSIDKITDLDDLMPTLW